MHRLKYSSPMLLPAVQSKVSSALAKEGAAGAADDDDAGDQDNGDKDSSKKKKKKGNGAGDAGDAIDLDEQEMELGDLLGGSSGE